MDRFDELLKCIANYNKQFSIYAKQYLNSPDVEYFDNIHKKHYCNQLNKLLITNFNFRDINYIEMCLVWCFKTAFDSQSNKYLNDEYNKRNNKNTDEIILNSQNNFYNSMIDNSYEMTKQLTEQYQNILQLAKIQLNGFSDTQYILFKKCIEQFNDLEY